MKKPFILILNGPNLQLLGRRQPDIYGSETLIDIEQACIQHGTELGLRIECRQSNHEGQLIDWIAEAKGQADGLILNAAALTHTSVALLDVLLATEIPCIEVHLSNIHQREEFRHHSFISKAAIGMICGLGSYGYILALNALAHRYKGH